MPDYTHMDNIVQWAVIQIRERRPLEDQEEELEVLYQFLKRQCERIVIEKLKVRELLPKPNDAAASQSAVEDDQL